MIAIVHSICSPSVHALALNAGLMDNDAERNLSIVCHNNYPVYVAFTRVFAYFHMLCETIVFTGR